MPSKYTFLLASILSAPPLLAQLPSVNGRVHDINDKTAVRGATITLLQISDSAFRYSTFSDRQGVFELKNVIPGAYTLRISSIGYATAQQQVSVKEQPINLDTVFISKKASLLEEVTVSATPPPLKQKDDTLEYNAGSFKVNPDANADDMIKKMPGISIDQGTVTAGGEEVKKVTVDGRDFFGDDAMAALKNLPAEIIDKVQVYDRLSDQAKFTGFEDANTTKAINIVTKAGMRNGQFGRLYAGLGTDNRYSAGGNASIFKNNRRISLVGLTNNINQQNFSTEDLLGVTSSSSRGGGGGQRRGSGGRGAQGGGGNRGFGGTGNFLVGQQGGISKTNAFGVNYSDLWGKKTEVSGSYFFNNSHNTSNEEVNREFFLSGDSSQLYDENSLSSSKNFNHRANLRIEHKIDSSNIILFTPSISFQDNDGLNNVSGVNSIKNTGVTSQSINSNTRNISGYNINSNLLYRHAFKKRGRTISLNLNTGFNNRKGETYLEAINKYYDGSENTDSLRQLSHQLTTGTQLSANIAYTEPLGNKGQLQVNYNPSWSRNNADQQTFQYDYQGEKYSFFDSSLSNKYDNIYTTQNGGVTYRIGDRNNMLSAGLSYQYANLSGDQVFPYATAINRNFSNLLPTIMLRKKLSEKSSLRLSYRAGTNAPSITQLQDVIDNSNPLFLRTGNTELNQQYSHRVVARYVFTNGLKGQTFLANLFFQKTDDYIGNATYIASSDSALSSSVILYKGSQLTKPVNMDGYWNLRSFFTFGMPLKFIKSNLNWNAGYSYSKTPGLVNGTQNVSNTQNYNIGAVLGSNISEYVDFNLSYTANFNTVKNSIQPALNNNYFTQVAGIQVNLLSKSGWFIINDLSNQSYSGLTDGFNQNFWLWNVSAGKKFLKNQKGDLRLSVFDLLKQNKSITRTTTETYIEDVQTQVLQQYFMLTFSYKLRNFGGKK